MTSSVYEERMGAGLQLQKPLSHEHEENLYEMIPDYVQSPGSQGITYSSACHVIPTSGTNSQSSGSPESHGRNSAGEPISGNVSVCIAIKKT